MIFALILEALKALLRFQTAWAKSGHLPSTKPGSTQCVFGEKFVTHLTICEVEMKPQAFEELRRAVRESDQAIRNKVGAMWKWDLCLMDHAQNRAALCIGWLDFA